MPAASFSISGPTGVAEVPLSNGSTWKIGRDQSCAVVLQDDVVSRRHAMIQLTENDEYLLIDLGSRNGTFLNDARVSTPCVLADGDQIRIGVCQLQFRCDSSVRRTDETASAAVDASVTKAMYAPRLVSVLVVDVRGYTKLAQIIDHALLCQLIGSWFREAGQIMEKYGAWALKYIGDAVMAVWLHDRPADKQRQIMRILRASCEFARVTAGCGSSSIFPTRSSSAPASILGSPRWAIPEPVRIPTLPRSARWSMPRFASSPVRGNWNATC
jgi:adenylate cyclase